ncbi:MAG: family 20 glycosylhydrolase [Phycisphaerae bacterium]|nr:family 20 glycosylhydrolase [Phycisphaerae bacterium]
MVVPVQKVTWTEGCFIWPVCPLLASPYSADTTPLAQLLGDLQRHLHIRGYLVRNAFGPAAIRIQRDSSIRHPEAYRMVIEPDAITVISASDAGAYYGVQTLRDIVYLCGRQIPCCVIDDQPVFSRRGVYHDCSRGKVPTLHTLKQLVERLAHWKINELQLYVENVFTFVRHPLIGKGCSPFTPEEILALQDWCRQHHIRLVGSLASFGHLEKILCLPPYRHLGEMYGIDNSSGSTTLCPIDPGSIKLLAELYEEYVPLFEAEDFNVCCDETTELGKGRSRRRADKIGAGQVYLDFVLNLYKLCQRYGKRMNMWADILLEHPELLDKLPHDIVLLNWEYEADGTNIRQTPKIAQKGLPLMVCPGTSSWLTHGSRLDNAMRNIAGFAQQGRRCHAEGLLNADWGDRGHRNLLGISLHGFAYGAACAWNPANADNSRFTEHFCRLTFGQCESHLAKAVRILGTTYRTCGAPRRNGSFLFEGMTEPMPASEAPSSSAIDKMTSAGLKKIVSQLSSDRLWPTAAASLPEFERLALAELKLAAKMDLWSAQRALAAKNLRTGQPVSAKQIRLLAEQMKQIEAEFSSLWMARCKPSRLCDNLRLFKKTRQQMLRLIPH